MKSIAIKPTEINIAATRDALACQDASNASGVARLMVRHMSAILNESRNTQFVNQHPAIILFLDKMTSLSRSQGISGLRINQAWDVCEKIKAGQEAGWEILV